MSTMRTTLACVAPRHRRDLALGMILLSCTELADGETIPEPRGTGQMACVELVSKLKTEGATLAPLAPRTLQEMKPRFTRPGLFLCLADSGFLIIRIILDGLETDTFSLAAAPAHPRNRG